MLFYKISGKEHEVFSREITWMYMLLLSKITHHIFNVAIVEPMLRFLGLPSRVQHDMCHTCAVKLWFITMDKLAIYFLILVKNIILLMIQFHIWFLQNIYEIDILQNDRMMPFIFFNNLQYKSLFESWNGDKRIFVLTSVLSLIIREAICSKQRFVINILCHIK